MLRPDSEGDVWLPDQPVIMVHWGCAVGYCRWLAERSQQPWRLPGELEWEKAARGVDGRFFPWGDVLDPSWCCMRDSYPGRSELAVVDSFAVDESPFGVRGCAGNVRDFCADLFTKEGPMTVAGRVEASVLPASVDLSLSASRRVVRGGSWHPSQVDARLADRYSSVPSFRYAHRGFRLARSLAPFVL